MIDYIRRNSRRIIGYLSKIEGYVHLTVSIIGFWGCYSTNNWDIRLWIAPAENFLFGFVALLAGYQLHKDCD